MECKLIDLLKQSNKNKRLPRYGVPHNNVKTKLNASNT